MVRIDIARDCHESKIRCSLLCVPAVWNHRQIWGRIVKSGSTRHDFHAAKKRNIPFRYICGSADKPIRTRHERTAGKPVRPVMLRPMNGLRPGPVPRARIAPQRPRQRPGLRPCAHGIRRILHAYQESHEKYVSIRIASEDTLHVHSSCISDFCFKRSMDVDRLREKRNNDRL